MMTPEQAEYFTTNVEPLERMLTKLELGELFTGILYQPKNQPFVAVNLVEPFVGVNLVGFGDGTLQLSAMEVGRLFMAPDDSLVVVKRLQEQSDGTPAGIHVFSDNDFVQEGELVDIVAYQDDDGTGIRVDALRLSKVLLAPEAPARLCTVAFGLMACTAYRLGFREITLYAAGNGSSGRVSNDDATVGYFVWPKFGFDAPLDPVDLNSAPHLAQCSSVQDVVAADAAWWNARGRGREMTFDLTPSSRSWNVLLHYLYDVFAEELS